MGVLWGRSFLNFEAAAPPSWPPSSLGPSQGGEVQTELRGRRLGWGRGKAEGRLGRWTVRGGAGATPGAVGTAYLETDQPCWGSPAGAQEQTEKSEGAIAFTSSVVQTGPEAALRLGSSLLPRPLDTWPGGGVA